ncbi:hypothetical protein QFC19_006715 [Naganishia cerealis]|uniref:Uncharacterized protein n=1 Tax=Naganishia cerealis TaxID=610337 RepID=A0ACC2VG14_9TREE|nr:hypothetical protein QFC19_006715 [Naganishia cerealis]
MNDRLFVDPYELEDRWGRGIIGDGEAVQTEEERLAKREEGTASPLTDQVSELPSIADPTEGLSWSLNPAPDLERPVRYLFKRQLRPPFHATSHQPQLVSSSSNAIPPSPEMSIYNSQYPYEAILHVVQKPSHQPNKSGDVISVDLDIPTHMRYQEPTNTTVGYRRISLGDVGTLKETGEAPETDVLISAYWICSTSDLPVHDPHIAEAKSPIDFEGDTAADYQYEPHKSAGFDITPLHLVPEAEGKPHELELPTAIGSHIAFVPPITFVCILLSWIYISRALYRIFRRSRHDVAT